MNRPMPSAPLLRVKPTRNLGRTVYLLEVACPYCNRTHTHGGGTDRTQVPMMLGARVSHCAGPHWSYAITDPDGIA